MATTSKPILNEYAVVRLEKPVRGVPGKDMDTYDPRRMRYYVRAENNSDAIEQMRARYPEEHQFAAMLITENVKPHFKEGKEVKVAA